jgi:hypothetical protein
MQLANHTDIINRRPARSCKDGPCILLNLIIGSLLSGNNSIIDPARKIVISISKDFVILKGGTKDAN